MTDEEKRLLHNLRKDEKATEMENVSQNLSASHWMSFSRWRKEAVFYCTYGSLQPEALRYVRPVSNILSNVSVVSMVVLCFLLWKQIAL